MIARVWHGVVPIKKAGRYAQYLSDFGVRDYRTIPENRSVCVLRRVEGNRTHFLLFSLWESWESIRAYAGSDPEQAHYYPFDLECLLEPEPHVTHYEVLVALEADFALRGSEIMIARIWHGKTKASTANDYRDFLIARAIPDYQSIIGNLGVHILRRIEGDAAHFITLTFWENAEAIKAFAGEDLEKAKYYPEDKNFLLEFEPKVTHYETVMK
jgi:heme-degrading monooxygenase HmoA